MAGHYAPVLMNQNKLLDEGSFTVVKFPFFSFCCINVEKVIDFLFFVSAL